MKILIVTPYFYPSVGGVQNYVLNIARGLLKEYGHEVVIVTSGQKRGNIKKEKFEGMTVYRLPYQLKISNTPISFSWKRQIRRIIESEKPNIINMHTPVPFMADVAARSVGRKSFILTYHNDLTKNSMLGNLLAKTFYILFSRHTMRQSNHIIATSEYYLSISPYLHKYKYKVSIVSPGVNLKRFNDQLNKNWLKKKYPGKRIILFVGSLEKSHAHKGIDVLLKAGVEVHKAIPNTQLVIAGTGDAIPEYQDLAKARGIEDYVSFPGFLTDSELPLYYAGADIFVLPSINDSEGFGMVLIEAQACGTPVICSNIGGMPFVVENRKTGLLVKPNSATELSKAILLLLKDRVLGTSVSIAATKRISQEFGWDTQINKINRLFVKNTEHVELARGRS